MQPREEPIDQNPLDLNLGEAAALDWQPELDSALEAIDSRLPVKRRRSTEPPGTALPRPEVSVPTFTPDVLDALATRVVEKLRTAQVLGPAPAPPVREEPRMKPGALLTIRYRWPLFSFRSARYARRVRARA